jgi:outer membrane protein OmpA-like peptidoglycan-associated protein
MRKILGPLKIGGFCLLVLLMVTGCGPKSRFIVMPDPDGKVGKVEVTTRRGSQTLDQAWQSTEVKGIDQMPSAPKVLDEKQVREMFKDALDARPEKPLTYLIYFKSGGTEITVDSLQTIPEVLKTIRDRDSTEISVSGHTDSVGSIEFNRVLSLNRARVVASILVSQGVGQEVIEITYHGKENQLVRTPDGVAEPRNRRVEITIR